MLKSKSLFDCHTCAKESHVDGSREDCTRCLDKKARTLKRLKGSFCSARWKTSLTVASVLKHFLFITDNCEQLDRIASSKYLFFGACTVEVSKSCPLVPTGTPCSQSKQPWKRSHLSKPRSHGDPRPLWGWVPVLNVLHSWQAFVGGWVRVNPSFCHGCEAWLW